PTLSIAISSLLLGSTLLLSACAAVAPMPASAPAAESGSAASSWTEAPAEESAVADSIRSNASAAESERRVRPTSPVAEGRDAAAAGRPAYSAQYEPVTAGVVDDNADWDAYLDYLDRHRNHGAIAIDVRDRIIIQVIDDRNRPVHDAAVDIFLREDVVYRGRTDTAGRLIFLPRTLNTFRQQQKDEYRVTATKGWAARTQTFGRSDGDTWTLTIKDAPREDGTRLDLLFLMDATGSMSDEIDKLKASMADIADELARLPEQPDVRYGLVAYRDHGDEFVVRNFDFTDSLPQFQRTLAKLEASGGGDEPEALHGALFTAVHELSWRTDETVRMVVLVADAPPHIADYYGDLSGRYDHTVFDAVAQGIKIFPVGASGLNSTGEYVFRQLAQITGGKFVFLTYEDGSDPSSGPGTETDHDVENYSVNTLDRLIVRLVREELANLTQRVHVQPSSPLPQPVPATLSCQLDLAHGDSGSCAEIGAMYPNTIEVLESNLLRITLNPAAGFTRARFEIRYDQAAVGYSVNIGDSISNDGDGGDARDQSNDAELQILDNTVSVFASDYLVESRQDRLLAEWRGGIAVDPSTYVFEIADGSVRFEGFGDVESPYLFALDGQSDREGPVNFDIYATFNRNITGDRLGVGVRNVTVTLFGPEQ
ncbi:MAG: VWA domain-containing protein, partial [Caldilineaceae bacterium]|nr:VWA domain-containing protein [Caldilineaceae bacterium]